MSKATKFRKLIIGATNVKTRMQKYCGKVCDGGYTVAPLHVSSDGQRRHWWWFNFRSSKEHDEGLLSKALHGTMGLSSGFFDERRLLKGGDGGYGGG